MEAFRNSDPSCVMFGKVISDSPLKIQVNVKLILEKNQLILTRNVTDYDLYITPDNWSTNTASGHSHTISGKKKIKVHNALTVGEEVILIRQAGGQEYIVLDRVG